MPVDHILQAIRSPRYLVSAWPWRGLAYAVTTCLVLPVVCFGGFILAAPWLGAVAELSDGGIRDPEILALMFLSVGAVVTLGPLVAMPVAALERQRLGIVDKRPAVSGHPPFSVGRLFARYTDTAAWRELAYLLLLTFVGPFVYGAVAGLVVLDAVFIVSPMVAAAVDDPLVLRFGPVDSTWQVVPFGLLGLALVPLIGYVFGVLAGGHAALARALLTDPRASALREVTRSRARLVDAFEAERRRIERDLHDGAQHRLTSLSLQLAVARLDVNDETPAAQALDKAHAQAKELMVVLRDLIHGIRPQVLTELGLPAAVAELAAESAIPVTVTHGVRSRLPERLETAAYFAVSEALANVAKHSRAKTARVKLDVAAGRVVVEVSDDGRGGADPARGSGLTGLADRIAAVNGRLLLSSPAGGPTLVRVELPWNG